MRKLVGLLVAIITGFTLAVTHASLLVSCAVIAVLVLFGLPVMLSERHPRGG